MSHISRIKSAVIEAFMLRGMNPEGTAGIHVFETPTEEILEAQTKRKAIKLFGARPGYANPKQLGSSPERLEENYLFGTRRFPADTSLTVLPAAPHIIAGQFGFFSNAIGQPGVANGFGTGFTLSSTETNMDVPSQVPQGKAFRMVQLGISFNTEAAPGDIEQILDAGALLLQKQGAQWGMRQGPFRFWPGGTGVSGFTTNQGQGAAHNGVADPRAVRTLKVPRDIKNMETFDYLYDVPRSVRATAGTSWSLSQFTLASVWLWGAQVDRIPS